MEVLELTPGVLAAALWEALKWFIRMYVVKNPDWSLQVKWNLAIVAILSYLITPLMALLGMGSYSFPTDWLEFVRQLLILVLQVTVGMTLHAIALRPASTMAKFRSRKYDGPK